MMNHDHYNKIAKYLHHKATNEAAVEACISRLKKNGLDETSIAALSQLTNTMVDSGYRSVPVVHPRHAKPLSSDQKLVIANSIA
ncbi:hypothetical protein EC973_005473 [Apophysomyces ossiformis]|uniref:Uncharacterized protein n=1 Tax=Apophysomyces ossiformis TaxID=679940 RepID=A0A8H7ES62_9FUNG|nr:hypothetical protein EC973_005473 [Apophysomyces ossiformis]